MKLTEKYLKRVTSIRGRSVNFNIDSVRLPNNKKALREYLDHPGAVAVIPLVDSSHVVLVRQYRYPVREITWELPAGKLHKGEAPLSCVKRELKEETGYTAKRMIKLLSFWPTAAFANEVIHIYVATGLKPGAVQLDEDEFVNSAVWSLKNTIEAIRKGHIRDSKTIIGLLAYKQFKKKIPS